MIKNVKSTHVEKKCLHHKQDWCTVVHAFCAFVHFYEVNVSIAPFLPALCIVVASIAVFAKHLAFVQFKISCCGEYQKCKSHHLMHDR